MYRTLFGILATFAAALLIVGLTFSASVEVPAELTFVNSTEPTTLDPQLMTGQPEGRIAWGIFEGLTRHDARTLEPAPGVAERWEISPDGKTYTFYLRESAVWTDGRKITARDFVYSWKRLLDPALGSEYSYIIYPVKYAEALHSFGGHAEALATKVRPALKVLLERSPHGVDAGAWQRFLAEHHVHALFQAARREQGADVLSRRTGTVSRADLTAFDASLSAVLSDLRSGEAEARRRFGVDGGVYARDERTLVVELRAPTPYFLEITSFYPTLPAPEHVVRAHPHDWFLPEHIVTNGPFRLERWVVNDRIRLVKSDSYWGKKDVRLNVVDALPLENPTTALNLYLTGDVDWLPDNYPKELVDELKTRPDFYKNPSMAVYLYRLNNTRRPLNDARVRQALNLAIDRKVIVEKVLGLGQLVAAHVVPPGMPGYEPPESHVRLDVERARALLAEAGYPGGQGLPELGILYNTHEGHKKIAEVVADQLRRNLGVRVKAYNQEWQSYQATQLALDYDMARFGWIGDYADPNTFLDLWVTNGGNNQTGYSSHRYDELIRAASDVAEFLERPEPVLGRVKEPDRIRRWLDAARGTDARARVEASARIRMQLFREAEAILVQDEFPVIPIFFYVVSGLVKPRAKGIYTTLVFPDGRTAPNLQDLHPLRDMWVREEAR